MLSWLNYASTGPCQIAGVFLRVERGGGIAVQDSIMPATRDESSTTIIQPYLFTFNSPTYQAILVRAVYH